MAANCSQPSAQVASIWGVRRKRSTMGTANPAAWARAKSLALSIWSASVFSRSKAARRFKALFLVAVDALAMAAEATLACCPKICIGVCKVVCEFAFMTLFSHS